MEDIGLYVTYFLFIVAAGATVVLPLINAIKEPKALAQSLLGLGVIVVLFLIAYSISGSEVTPKYALNGVTESSSKLIGGGLGTFYILLVAGLLGIVVSEINKALK